VGRRTTGRCAAAAPEAVPALDRPLPEVDGDGVELALLATSWSLLPLRRPST
jgi:hypothetical protein